MLSVADQITAEVREELRRCMQLSRTVRNLQITFDGYEHELEAEIHFYGTPAEPRAWDYPGYPADVEIVRVLAGGLDLQPLLSKEQQEALSADILRGRVDE